MEPKSKAKAAESQDRRKQILRAAIDVFSERGFHRTRVSDIAKRAGVAYGLIYHYFDSKDDVLNSVFQENWSVFLKVLRDCEADETRSAGDRLASIADLLINALRIEPALIQVIIGEFSRSDRFVHPMKVDAFQEGFRIVQRIIEQGQANSEIRDTLDAQVGAFIFFGALETICTGFMINVIPCKDDDDAARLKTSVKETILRGMILPDNDKDT